MQSLGKLAEYRWLKLQLINILHRSTPFCGVCLATEQPLSSVDDQIVIPYWKSAFCSTLRQFLEALFSETILQSENICEDCRASTVDAYLFIYNTRQTTCILEDYIQQINNGIDEINHIADTNLTDYSNMQLVLQDPTLSIQRVKPLQIASDSDIDCEESVQSLKTEDAQYDEIFTLASSIIEQIETSNEYETGDEVIQQKYVTCSDCDEDECGHYKYLVSYEKQKASGQKKICFPECSYECRQKDLFVAHINEFHMPSIFCKHCSKSLHSIKAYKLHLTHFHSKMLVCEYCDSNFKFDHNLLKHKEFCNMATKEFLCDECSGFFTSYRKLEYHKLNHHNKSSSFPCPSCDKVFVKLRLLNAHKRVHIEAQMKRRKLYECGICHNTYKTAKERNQHRSTHKPNEKHNCSKCSITFETQSEFMHHMSQEHYETSKPKNLKCPHCDYSTCGKEFLEAHVNRFHLKLSPYACPQCPKKFTNMVKLRTHLKTHDPDKKHSCGTCGKLFCGPVALRKHMRLHTGEKPYKCDFCDKSFICASTRNDHRDRKHKAKLIQCPLCPSKFHTLGMLRAHIKKYHWKQEGKFDVTKVEGLNEEHYELFRDRRLEIF